MLCIVTENGWSNIIYNYAKKFDSFALSALFFNSFYLLVKFIILSLLTGLIWEIFTIISSNYNQNEEKNKKNLQSSGDNSSPDMQNNVQESEEVASDDCRTSTRSLRCPQLSFYKNQTKRSSSSERNSMRSRRTKSTFSKKWSEMITASTTKTKTSKPDPSSTKKSGRSCTPKIRPGLSIQHRTSQENRKNLQAQENKSPQTCASASKTTRWTETSIRSKRQSRKSKTC